MERALTLPRATDWVARSIDAAGEAWCRAMHRDITWPQHGRYRCRRCGRGFHVPWEERAVWRGRAAHAKRDRALLLPTR